MPEKPTVLNISQKDIISGGSDIYWRSLGQLLEINGHQVKYFSCSNSTPSLPSLIDFEKPGVKQILKHIYNPEAKKKILPYVENIDIAHLHIYYGMLTSSILTPLKKQDIPMVQTLHEYKLVCPIYTMERNGKICFDCKNNNFYNATKNKCKKNSLPRSVLSSIESYVSLSLGSQELIQKFITVSDFQKNMIVKMGFPEGKLETVHNFIDHTEYTPTPFIGEFLLYFGRIEKVKGIETLLRAIKLASKKSNVKLVMAGTGSYLPSAIKLAEELEISDKVSFLGHCEKATINTLLGQCFASVTPSIWAETFGLTLIESLCMERPVIASNIGGMTEILEDEKTGLFVTPGSAIDLAEKISFLYENPSVCIRYGEAGRQAVIRKFSPQFHYQRVNEIYLELLK